MAIFSTSFTPATLTEQIFLSPHNPTKRQRRGNIGILGTRVRAVQREESAVVDEKDRELVTELNARVNGNGNVGYSYSNGSVGKYTNGSVKVESGNGSLVNYVNGKGNARSKVERVKVSEVISRKKSVEEIGQEEAWFKRKVQEQVEVYRDFITFYVVMLFVYLRENFS